MSVNFTGPKVLQPGTSHVALFFSGMGDDTYGRLVFRRLHSEPPSARRLSQVTHMDPLSPGALRGNLVSSGYFAANMCLGTPPKRFELIVDTGSSITSVPCRRCASCGAHRCGRRGRFDERASSTAERAKCPSFMARTGGLKCERCEASTCSYQVGYLEGSSIQGHVLRDLAAMTPPALQASSVAAASGDLHRRHRLTARRHVNGSYMGAWRAARSVRVYFGCALHESGKLRKQEADGILGLQADDHHASPRSSRVPSVLNALVAQHGVANAFSLCLSSRAGRLLFGGRTDAARMRLAGASISPMVADSPERFTLRLLDVRMQEPMHAAGSSISAAAAAKGDGGTGTLPRVRRRSDAGAAWGAAAHLASVDDPPTTAAAAAQPPHWRFESLGVPSSVYSPALVDSGTTFFFAATPVYQAIHQRLRRACPALRRLGAHHICAHLTMEQLDRLPAMELVLQGSGAPRSVTRLLVRPQQYMVRYSSPRPPHARRAGERRGERHYCAEIFDNGPRGGTVLGAAVLRGREVIFDLENSTIAFVDADCDNLRAATAQMQSGWAFAPCPAVDHASSRPKRAFTDEVLTAQSRRRGGGRARKNMTAASSSRVGALIRWPWGLPWT